MTDTASPSFAVFVQGDAYSTAGKIMGRQAAGEGLVRGLGRTYAHGRIQAVASGQVDRAGIKATLADGGFDGSLQWSREPDYTGAKAVGALYYPAPPNAGIARMRNRLGPASFSLFGITHTLSTDRTMDGIGVLAMPPFKPWDALICTSKAALGVVEDLLEEVREELRREAGVERFSKVQLPVIPLGVNCDAIAPPTADQRAAARSALGLADDEVAVLFAGRLSFHAKANPAALYRGLQALAGEAKIVCIEAGLFPNDGIKATFQAAQKLLAPGVRFLHAAGDDPAAYAAAWKAADIFTSLSDNIQETFGLTPVEAMSAGLPVIASDWNGYRDNIRHGEDGFLIPTLAAPPGAGTDLALVVETFALSYDRQIGLASLGVAIDGKALIEALRALVGDPALRRRMGESGRQRALAAFDWPVVLRAYDDLAKHLAVIRAAGSRHPPEPWPQRADPFRRFSNFATRTIGDDDLVSMAPNAGKLLQAYESLGISNYAFDDMLLPKALPGQLTAALHRAGGTAPVKTLLAVAGGAVPANQRALAWLVKFGVVEIARP